jgi:hypothetical protein
MKKLLLILVLALIGADCFSQTPVDVSKGYDYNKLYSLTYNPTGHSSIVTPFTQLNFTSTFKDQEATATIGAKKGKSAFSIFIKQPFSEKPKKVTPISLDGLGNGTSIEFSYQFSTWKPQADFDTFDKIRNQYAKQIGKITREEINSITYGDLDSASKEKLEELKAIKWKHPFIAGISYSLGKAGFDYLSDSASVTPLQMPGLNQNIRFTVGTIISGSQVLAFSYILQYKYNTGDPVSYIFPVGANGASFSKDVIVGKPERGIDSRVSVEYRLTIFNKDTKPSLAINPSISCLFNKKMLSFNLPIYFLNYTEEKENKGLQGGVELGILSKTNPLFSFSGFTAAIFITAPFDMFGLFKSK